LSVDGAVLEAEAHIQEALRAAGKSFRIDPIVLHQLGLRLNDIRRLIWVFEQTKWFIEEKQVSRMLNGDLDDELLLGLCRDHLLDAFAAGVMSGLRLASGDAAADVYQYLNGDLEGEGKSYRT
jgi:hypothetical protein